MEPGTENAYIILERPELPGGPAVETIILDKLSQVLDTTNARKEILSFLARHPDLKQAVPEQALLESRPDAASKLRLAEMVLDEGDAERALSLIPAGDTSERAALARARAHRLRQGWTEAANALRGVAPSAGSDLELARLAFEQGRDPEAARRLDAWLQGHGGSLEAAEAYFMRGWVHHRTGDDERAADVWLEGIERHPPTRALFSQKARLTVIRMNWDLPASVDQAK
jgi:hypothetical protein